MYFLVDASLCVYTKNVSKEGHVSEYQYGIILKNVTLSSTSFLQKERNSHWNSTTAAATTISGINHQKLLLLLLRLLPKTNEVSFVNHLGLFSWHAKFSGFTLHNNIGTRKTCKRFSFALFPLLLLYSSSLLSFSFLLQLPHRCFFLLLAIGCTSQELPPLLLLPFPTFLLLGKIHVQLKYAFLWHIRAECHIYKNIFCLTYTFYIKREIYKSKSNYSKEKINYLNFLKMERFWGNFSIFIIE